MRRGATTRVRGDPPADPRGHRGEARVRDLTSDLRVKPKSRTHRIYSCGDLELDVDTRTIRLDGQAVVSTYVQFEMLLRLLTDPGCVLSREELAVLPGTAERAVDIQISRLRKRLARARRFAIETVPRVGYRCRELEDGEFTDPPPGAGKASF